ncbi:MAG: hypothetical protein H6708_24135 [Kofleriaceae bacterium]|nr:hypothetical protein [Kofleriaceae bacterium]
MPRSLDGAGFSASIPRHSTRSSSSSGTASPRSSSSASLASRHSAHVSRADLERHHAPDLGRIHRVTGQITGLAAGDQGLDLVHGLAGRRVEPCPLGVLADDPRQLAHRRVRLLAAGQRRRGPRQDLQRTGHAQSLARRARPVAERALEVLVQAGVAEPAVQLDLLREHQPARLIGVERGASSSDAAQLAIELSPVRGRVAVSTEAGTVEPTGHHTLVVPAIDHLHSSLRTRASLLYHDDFGPPVVALGPHDRRRPFASSSRATSRRRRQHGASRR